MACVGTLRTFGAPVPLTLGVRPHDMPRSSVLVALISSLGLGLSLWSTRPSDLLSLGGWGFATISSLAWCISVALSVLSVVRPARLNVAIGGTVVLGSSELVLLAFSSDPLLLAGKPVYQLLLLVVGTAIGALFAAKSPLNGLVDR